MDDRINHPNMEYFRIMYKNSERWNGKDDLKDKKVIIYTEQGYGDQIMFLRFVRFLQAMECHITLHAPKPLHRLIKTLGVGVIDRTDEPLPEHDYHIMSFDLPFLLGGIIPLEPYIHVKEKTELLPGKNIGIAWEGSQNHEYNNYRNCPLKHFKSLQKPGVNLWCIQQYIYDKSLIEDCEDMDLNGTEIEDFYDTAKLINNLDLVVTVDTAPLHLAAAMGKRVFVMLNKELFDPRWNLSKWYPTLTVLQGTWEGCFELIELLK